MSTAYNPESVEKTARDFRDLHVVRQAVGRERAADRGDGRESIEEMSSALEVQEVWGRDRHPLAAAGFLLTPDQHEAARVGSVSEAW